MTQKNSYPRQEVPQFKAVQPHPARPSGVLVNLLKDTSIPVLIALSEQYGLPRVPGLNHDALTSRLLRGLSSDQLRRLKDHLIAARFGGMSVTDLVDLALERDAGRASRQGGGQGTPRMDQISQQEALLLESGLRYWVYAIRGHEVSIDLHHRTVSCACSYFAFSARRQALCKHIAITFKMIPEVYARDALIDLLIWREYGTTDTPAWTFINRRTG